MELFVINTLSGLQPMYDSDLEEKKKLKLNQEYRAVITAPRNIDFHKKFFALINLGHQNTKLQLPYDTYRSIMTMRAGFVNIFETPKGILYLPKSISFASMNEIEFQDVYSRVLDQIIKDLGTTSDEITKALINFF